MSHPIRFSVIAVVVVGLAVIGLRAISAPPKPAETPKSTDTPKATTTSPTATETPKSMVDRDVVLTEAEAQAVEQFEVRLKDYAALHQKLEGEVEPLGEEATPEEIDAHRQALRTKIQAARANAKRGEFFTPGLESLVKRVCQSSVTPSVESAIMDENPSGQLPNVSVNDRYPDGVPVTTMPVQVLEALPKLNEYMEYRFLGKRLVLVDAGAGVVLDVTPDVL